MAERRKLRRRGAPNDVAKPVRKVTRGDDTLSEANAAQVKKEARKYNSEGKLKKRVLRKRLSRAEAAGKEKKAARLTRRLERRESGESKSPAVKRGPTRSAPQQQTGRPPRRTVRRKQVQKPSPAARAFNRGSASGALASGAAGMTFRSQEDYEQYKQKIAAAAGQNAVSPSLGGQPQIQGGPSQAPDPASVGRAVGAVIDPATGAVSMPPAVQGGPTIEPAQVTDPARLPSAITGVAGAGLHGYQVDPQTGAVLGRPMMPPTGQPPSDVGSAPPGGQTNVAQAPVGGPQLLGGPSQAPPFQWSQIQGRPQLEPAQVASLMPRTADDPRAAYLSQFYRGAFRA